jgi:hypothetical protein
MSLITDSDVYSPGMGEDGMYTDQIPCFRERPQGIRCPCNANVFSTRRAFLAHTSSRCHKQWLEHHNTNRQNYFQELEQSRTLVRQQQLIIAQLERDKNDLCNTIRILSSMPHNTHANDTPQSHNLLEFD